jgi:hypothetical protein
MSAERDIARTEVQLEQRLHAARLNAEARRDQPATWRTCATCAGTYAVPVGLVLDLGHDRLPDRCPRCRPRRRDLVTSP